jgi:membrane-associated phospholipid phosphatase
VSSENDIEAPRRSPKSNWRSGLRGESFFSHPQLSLALGLVFLACFTAFAVFVPTGPLQFERSWLDWMGEIRTPLLDHVALVCNWLGRGIGRALVIAAIAVPLVVRRRWVAGLAFAVTEALTPLLGDAVKAMVDRSRPPHGLVTAAGSSFPSGHASFAAATPVAIVVLFTRPGRRRRIWWALGLLGILAMAWSRTYLQVHWLLDVVAGSLLGAALSLVMFAAAQILLPPRRVRRTRHQPRNRSPASESESVLPIPRFPGKSEQFQSLR